MTPASVSMQPNYKIDILLRLKGRGFLLLDAHARAQEYSCPIQGLRTCMSSFDTEEPVRPHPIGTVSIAFNLCENFGTPNMRLFDAQSLCPHAPLPTLRQHPHGCRRTARGGGGG